MLDKIYNKEINNKNYEAFKFSTDKKEIYYLTIDKKVNINCIALNKNVFINQLVNSKLDKDIIEGVISSVNKSE